MTIDREFVKVIFLIMELVWFCTVGCIGVNVMSSGHVTMGQYLFMFAIWFIEKACNMTSKGEI